MKFTNVAIGAILSTLSFVHGSDDSTLLYSGTKICSKHKTTMCLSYDYDDDLLVLDKRHKLKFDIETIERVNMQINRVYTYAKDPSTKKKVKSCLIKKNITDYNAAGVGLAPCDTDDNELVLAVEAGSDSSIDEFILKEIAEDAESLCLTTTHIEAGELVASERKSQLKRRSPIVLTSCESEYAQEFKARSYDASASSRMITTEAPEVTAYIGKFCLSQAPDLCLGVSLEDGTNLVDDVLMQIKNYTKNEIKNLHDLKMRWYHDMENNRIASAANMNYCVEAVYGAVVGNNRAGTVIYDDVAHLGPCDPVSRVITVDNVTDLPASEHFYLNTVTTSTGSYLEIKTTVPPEVIAANSTEPSEKCLSVVKCVVHDSGRCTPYNSVPVYDAASLQQGAYVRLKDCDSESMASQQWFYVEDDEVTVPPTNYPTPKPATNSPTKSPTPAPTQKPTVVATEPLPPTDGDSGSTDNNTVKKSGNTGLKAGLAFVGVLCFAVIVMGVTYYYKHRNEFQNLPEEDENFIARV